MKIIISGYGRMGKEVEKAAIENGLSIAYIIDDISGWEGLMNEKVNADVVIDFSQPDIAVENILRCFEIGIPIVTGTTGWYEQLEKVNENCKANKGSLFFAPNFSIGVNLFLLINAKLASTMSSFDDYKVSVKEIHHIHKLDAPSGTAIKIANDIVDNHQFLREWVNQADGSAGILPVASEREGEIPGTHVVRYESPADLIEIKHEAKNRSGFANGAITAAAWLIGRRGVFTMKDMLHSLL
jgi:4-hydroxy-tetrahydrodipicolinate reductase